jgi:hypothetical protein
LAAGLALGVGLALWLELRDSSLRTESDILAVLQLPVLSQVPWVGADAEDKDGSGGRKRGSDAEDHKKDMVEV